MISGCCHRDLRVLSPWLSDLVTNRRLYDKPVPTDQAALIGCWPGWPGMGRSWSWSISPAPIGAMAIAVAHWLGIDVGYLPAWACAASPIWSCIRLHTSV